eukprot:32934-Eustigmatos_ZCMA.PRE.1
MPGRPASHLTQDVIAAKRASWSNRMKEEKVPVYVCLLESPSARLYRYRAHGESGIRYGKERLNNPHQS